MEKEKKLPERKSHRLKDFDYNTSGAYFVTICTMNRQNYFWDNDWVTNVQSNSVGATIGRPQDVELSQAGKIVCEAINNISSVYPNVTVDHYVIMPDHIHLILAIINPNLNMPTEAPALSRIIQQFKGYITKRIGHSIWQKLFYDHVIRSKEDYEEHVKYIYDNPKKMYYERIEIEPM